MKHTAWEPSVKWHLVCVGICLVICAGLLGTFTLASKYLPTAYRTRACASQSIGN